MNLGREDLPPPLSYLRENAPLPEWAAMSPLSLLNPDYSPKLSSLEPLGLITLSEL